VESDAGYFGERVAATYDEDSASMFDPAVLAPAVDRLVEFAGDGRALEFAIGTGRIALPLAERGVRVAGIDNSPAMLFNLTTQDGQVACFENAAAHLGSGGRFVVEGACPGAAAAAARPTVLPWRADPGGIPATSTTSSPSG
jgi:SAM-dependent methyltransferase